MNLRLCAVLVVPTSDDVSSVVSYYESLESRVGYRLFLRGEKHLGWHPHGLVLPDTIARRLATLRALDGLHLTDVTAARVLDAGCGLGGPSRLIASLGPHVDAERGALRNSQRRRDGAQSGRTL